MQIIQDTVDFKVPEKTVVAIGKFDGIHKGHQILLEEMRKAKEEGLKTVIFTFVPSPAAFFLGKECKELSTEKEKREFFQEIGIDVLIEFPLNQETAAILPINFITEILVNQLNVQRIVAGTDLSFGAKGEGNCTILQKYAEKYAYDIVILNKVSLYGREISSTFIREEIERGNIERANELLGKTYQIAAVVETIEKNENEKMRIVMEAEENKLLPPIGMYTCVINWESIRFKTKVFLKGKQNPGKEEILYMEIVLNKEVPLAVGSRIKIELIRNKARE